MNHNYLIRVADTFKVVKDKKTKEERKEKAEIGYFVCFDIVDKLDSFGDIIRDGVKQVGSEKIFLDDTSKMQRFLNKNQGDGVNFKLGVKKIETTSENAKLRLKFSPITILVKGVNQVGSESGFIYSFINKDEAQLGKISYKELVKFMLKNSGKVSNMYLKLKEGVSKKSKNPDDYILTSYNDIQIPTMVVGQKLKNQVKIEPKIDKTEDKKERRIIKIMRKEGFGAEVDKYKLYNKAYPEDTLFFYLELFEAGKKDIVGSMLTTQNYDMLQLKQIALGVESGADIRLYADPKIDAKEMEMVRTALEIGQWKNQVVFPTKMKEIQRKLAKQKNKDPKLEKVIREYKKAVVRNTKGQEGETYREVVDKVEEINKKRLKDFNAGKTKEYKKMTIDEYIKKHKK